MKKNDKEINRSIMLLGVAIILVQLVDIVVHILAGQVELIRILSNIIIMVWVLSNVFSSIQVSRLTSVGVVMLYLVLNILFLFLEGLWNPYGGHRIMFFILIILTSLLSIFFIRKTNGL